MRANPLSTLLLLGLLLVVTFASLPDLLVGLIVGRQAIETGILPTQAEFYGWPVWQRIGYATTWATTAVLTFLVLWLLPVLGMYQLLKMLNLTLADERSLVVLIVTAVFALYFAAFCLTSVAAIYV
jgi:hypothetical protein